MKVLIQRVNRASVSVGNQVRGSIRRGLMLLVGLGKGDGAAKLLPVAEKIAAMRIFPNQEKKFDLSLMDIQGGVLLVPQFTLYADTSKGRRPDFFNSLEPAAARQLFQEFVQTFKQLGVAPVEQGEFGAHMLVSLENDGPVTIMLEM